MGQFFVLLFTSLKNYRNSKNHRFSVKKLSNLFINTILLSTKFVLDTKFQISFVRIISNLGHNLNPVALNIGANGKKSLQKKKKFYRKCEFQGVWIELEIKNLFFSGNRGQGIVRKFIKLSQIGFFMECFTSDFLEFVVFLSKFVFLVSWLGTQLQFQALWECT